MADFSTEMITRENLIKTFCGVDAKAKFSAVSAGYLFAAELPDCYPFAEELATNKTKEDALRCARKYFGTIKLYPEEPTARAREKCQAMDAILKLFDGERKLEETCFCIQVGVQLRLRTERAFDITTEMLAMSHVFREMEAAATYWAAVRCLNLVANDIARGKNEHNRSHLCGKLLDACVPMRSWRFREHAISLVGALGAYSLEGGVVPLDRMKKIAEESKDSPTWSSAVVCIAHRIFKSPTGVFVEKYAPVLIKALYAGREQFRPWRKRNMERVYDQGGIALARVFEYQIQYHKQSPQLASQLIPAVVRLFLDVDLRGSRFASAVMPLIDALDYATKIKGVTIDRKTLRAAKALENKLKTAKPSFGIAATSLWTALHSLQSLHGTAAPHDVLGTSSVGLRRRGRGSSVRVGQRGTMASG